MRHDIALYVCLSLRKKNASGLVNGNFTEYRFFFQKNLYSVKFPFTKPPSTPYIGGIYFTVNYIALYQI
jgi:hypothetical protein